MADDGLGFIRIFFIEGGSWHNGIPKSNDFVLGRRENLESGLKSSLCGVQDFAFFDLIEDNLKHYLL